MEYMRIDIYLIFIIVPIIVVQLFQNLLLWMQMGMYTNVGMI